jgi:3-oxoacyl-[acyl-carrier protein] reductase
VSEHPFDLTGRVALVTGCGSESGIGHACARLLARLGAAVAVTATTDRVAERAAELRAGGAAATAHVADLTCATRRSILWPRSSASMAASTCS